MSDWNDLLLGPHYTEGVGSAVAVTLEIESALYPDLRAFDMTRGVAEAFQQTPSIQDIVPGLRFRAADLVARAIDPATLPGSRVGMNGKSWRIESQVPLASPAGEAEGEIACILAELP